MNEQQPLKLLQKEPKDIVSLVEHMASQAYDACCKHEQLGGIISTWSKRDEEISKPLWEADIDHIIRFPHMSVMLHPHELPENTSNYSVVLPARTGQQPEICTISPADIQNCTTNIEDAIGSKNVLTALLHQAVQDTAIVQALQSGDRGYAADVQKRLDTTIDQIHVINATPNTTGARIGDFTPRGYKKKSKIPFVSTMAIVATLASGCAGAPADKVCSPVIANAKLCQGYEPEEVNQSGQAFEQAFGGDESLSEERPLIAPVSSGYAEPVVVEVPVSDMSYKPVERGMNNPEDEIWVGPDGVYYLNPAKMRYVNTSAGSIAVPWYSGMPMLFTQGNHMGKYFDISANNAPIFSPIDGVLAYVYDDNGNSRVIVYDPALGPNAGLRFELWHAKLDKTQPGQRIVAGQHIANMSNIGYSTENGKLCTPEWRETNPTCGTHGHLGLFYNNQPVEWVTPLAPFLGTVPYYSELP